MKYLMSIKKLAFYILNFAFLGLLTIACGGDEAPEQMDNSAETMDAATVSLTEAQMELAGIELGKPQLRTIADYVECTGRVEVPPYSLYSVFAPTTGFIRSAKYLPGDYVKKGTVLTSITHPNLVKLQREFLETQSQLAFLANDVERKETLAASDAASKKALEQARADLQLQQARYKGIGAELRLLGISTKMLEEQGDIQSAIVLRAPVSGYVTEVNINNGKLVSPSDLLIEMVDNSHIHLELQVFAKDIMKLKKGQSIECQLPGDTRTYPAEVYLVGKMIDAATKTTRVHGHFENEPVDLLPGTYVQAKIFMDVTEVLTVPRSALITEGDESFIFVQKGDTFEKVSVVTGRTDGDFIEIEPLALGENELVAIKGAYYINGSMGDE